MNKDVYKCEVCDYTCQKFTTLNKHRNTKHIGHVCQVCGKNLSNAMNLLQHVAIEHNEEDTILNSIISMDKDKKRSRARGTIGGQCVFFYKIFIVFYPEAQHRKQKKIVGQNCFENMVSDF